MPLSAGETFDRYRIEQLLGEGGWGQVYRAIDTRLRRKVALKVLKPERAAEAPRFLREARAAAALHHANVVAVYDLGEVAGVPFIAMELVEGHLLSDFTGPRSGRSIKERLAWLIDVARGIHASHEAGLLHRDVKPQNVMVTKGGSAKVLDFGLAKPTEPVVEDDSVPLTQPYYKTRAGHVVGTPRYMAPEALRGGLCDGRADQFSWGVTAYEVIAGVHPRGGAADPLGVDPPRLLSEFVPNVSFQLAAAVARTLAGDASQRFPDMGELIRTLEGLSSRTDDMLPPTIKTPAGELGATLIDSPMTIRDPTPTPASVPNFEELTQKSASPLLPTPKGPEPSAGRAATPPVTPMAAETARSSRRRRPPERSISGWLLALGIAFAFALGLGAAFVLRWRTAQTSDPDHPAPTAPSLASPPQSAEPSARSAIAPSTGPAAPSASASARAAPRRPHAGPGSPTGL